LVEARCSKPTCGWGVPGVSRDSLEQVLPCPLSFSAKADKTGLICITRRVRIDSGRGGHAVPFNPMSPRSNGLTDSRETMARATRLRSF
jgi:hypothetical protein